MNIISSKYYPRALSIIKFCRETRQNLILLLSMLISTVLTANCNEGFQMVTTDQETLQQTRVKKVIDYFGQDGFINSAPFRSALMNAHEQYGPDEIFEKALSQFSFFRMREDIPLYKIEKLKKQFKEIKNDPVLRQLIGETFNRLFIKHQKYYTEKFREILAEGKTFPSWLMGAVGVPLVGGPLIDMLFFSRGTSAEVVPLLCYIIPSAVWTWYWWVAAPKKDLENQRHSLLELKPIVLDAHAYQKIKFKMNN